MEARTVIVGDVHGCSAELEELVGGFGDHPETRWVFVGDLVARGPDSLGVLRRVRELGAQAVLGNHELRLLEVRRARSRGEPGPRLGPGHQALFEALAPADWELLAAMPLWLELPEHELTVVHAGIDPRLELSEQRPEVLTRMRSWEAGEPSERFREESWAARYAGPRHVVFGHNARLGLQLHTHATGLDSGCVYGGRLSALVLPAGGRVLPAQSRQAQIVSVAARKQYFSG